MLKKKEDVFKVIDSWMVLGCPGLFSIVQLPDKSYDIGIKKIVKRREMPDELKKAFDYVVKELGGARMELIIKQGGLDRVEIYHRLEDKDVI